MNNDYVTEKCYDRMIRSEMVNKREQMTLLGKKDLQTLLS